MQAENALNTLIVGIITIVSMLVVIFAGAPYVLACFATALR